MNGSTYQNNLYFEATYDMNSIENINLAKMSAEKKIGNCKVRLVRMELNLCRLLFYEGDICSLVSRGLAGILPTVIIPYFTILHTHINVKA